ncbi:AraC family transcriptional regulator [Paenibacillus sp. GYB003]|uniref:AraC family transcriptional regulator n=1 Tax=Paenibacillus sp. GYB003 TaxID=2994392 RepID=UPI002F96D5C9
MFELDPSAEGLKFQLHTRWVRNMLKPRDFTFGPVINPFPVFWLVLDGSREIEIAGKRYRVGEGDLVVYTPGIPYRLVPASSGGLFHYLSLGCEAKIGPFGLHEVYPLPEITSDADKRDLEALAMHWRQLLDRFERLGDALRNREGTPWSGLLPDPSTSVLLLRLQETLYRWFAECLALLRRRIPEHTLKLDPRIVRACVYIREHVHESIRLEDLASQVYVSPSHFNYLFRRSLGLPPAEYLRKYRIQHAKELLILTNLPIGEISARVGYDGQSQFSRAFRKAEGKGPLAYRREWQQREPGV